MLVIKLLSEVRLGVLVVEFCFSVSVFSYFMNRFIHFEFGQNDAHTFSLSAIETNPKPSILNSHSRYCTRNTE